MKTGFETPLTLTDLKLLEYTDEVGSTSGNTPGTNLSRVPLTYCNKVFAVNLVETTNLWPKSLKI